MKRFACKIAGWTAARKPRDELMVIDSTNDLDAALAALAPDQARRVRAVLDSGHLEGLEPSVADIDRLVRIASGQINARDAIAELDAQTRPTGKAARPNG